MRFLVILFYVFVALVLLVFAARNWTDVTLVLWRDLRMDIKLPFLVLLVGLLAWLPTWLVFRGRLWRARRHIAQLEHPIANAPAPVAQIREDA